MFATDNSGLIETYPLSDNYFNVERFKTYMEEILMGLINQPAQTNDKEVTEQATDLLFKEPGSNFGGDLVARNIQRGRDHGLPGFCCYYQMYDDPSHDCNQGWDRRYHRISPENWELLKTLYNKPSDIDLFTGGLAQDPDTNIGGLTGKVFQAMKGKIETLKIELISSENVFL